ncbi:DNA repair and recombination protein RadB [Candidatus Woesearchaeota archaeon]|nr:DNA repair and recombination protein RadB [Candidatus Woesearchaeota archaeon]
MEIQKQATNTPIDKLLNGGIEFGAVTNTYGPAGSGKTNIAICTLLNCKNKIIYIDTEGSFSLERFKQLGGDEKKLKSIMFFEPHTWEEQHELVKKLEKMFQKEKIDIIIIDSLVTLYRLVLDPHDKKSASAVNRQLATQYSILSKIAREQSIPVLVTNQVYGSGEDIEITSKTIARFWSKCLVELRKGDKENQRIAILRKHRSLPEGKKISFEITEKGLKEIKFGLF